MEKAVLVGLVTFESSEEQTNEYLEELAFLAKTAGAKPIKKFIQKLSKPINFGYNPPHEFLYCEY